MKVLGGLQPAVRKEMNAFNLYYQKESLSKYDTSSSSTEAFRRKTDISSILTVLDPLDFQWLLIAPGRDSES